MVVFFYSALYLFIFNFQLQVICKTCNTLILQYEETVKKAFQLLNEIKHIYLLNNPLNTDFKCDEGK